MTKTAFHDLPADAFPFVIEIIDSVTREVTYSVTVESPGAVWIPGRGENDNPRTVRVKFANCQEVIVEPRERTL